MTRQAKASVWKEWSIQIVLQDISMSVKLLRYISQNISELYSYLNDQNEIDELQVQLYPNFKISKIVFYYLNCQKMKIFYCLLENVDLQNSKIKKIIIKRKRLLEFQTRPEYARQSFFRSTCISKSNGRRSLDNDFQRQE